MSDSCSILWFRQDLRVVDNPALAYAITQGSVLPIYIDDTLNCGRWRPGAASRWWLHHSLTALNRSLDGNLRLFNGDPLTIIAQLIEQTGSRSIAWNRCYEPWQLRRDKRLKSSLVDIGVNVGSFNGSLLWEPWNVLKADNSPYKLFTPYYRKGCLSRPAPRKPDVKPEKIDFFNGQVEALSIDSLNLIPSASWHDNMAANWQPGETSAAGKLDGFVNGGIRGYRDDREVPELVGTSRLSPHLHFGEISPNQIWYAALNALAPDIDNSHLDCFLSELAWREFSYYLMFHFPTIAEQNLQEKFDRFPWLQQPQALQAWQRGSTGIPIVDAGMRELWQTGYMHNRVRMIVGSFLVKNLLLHWSYGASWFWDCLVDADLASNSASWQWVAGCGADAAPYFRIFNPVRQGERFDREGRYVRRYCPEITALPDKFIHRPWDAPETVLNQAGVTLGREYPRPLVDLKITRQRALDAFTRLKKIG